MSVASYGPPRVFALLVFFVGAMGVASNLTEVVLFFLIVISLGIPRHIVNLIYVRRAGGLEGLLDAHLRCRFTLGDSEVVGDGTYKGKKIRIISILAVSRKSWFILMTRDLPKQKRFLLRYPRITQNVYMAKDSLFCIQRGSKLGRPYEFDRSKIVPLLDELVTAAALAEQMAKEQTAGGSGKQVALIGEAQNAHSQVI